MIKKIFYAKIKKKAQLVLRIGLNFEAQPTIWGKVVYDHLKAYPFPWSIKGTTNRVSN